MHDATDASGFALFEEAEALFDNGDFARAVEKYDEAASVFEAFDPLQCSDLLPRAVRVSGAAEYNHRNMAGAQYGLERTRGRYQLIGGEAGAAHCTQKLTQVAFVAVDYNLSLTLARECLVIFEHLQDPMRLAIARFDLGLALMRLQRARDAVPHLQAAVLELAELKNIAVLCAVCGRSAMLTSIFRRSTMRSRLMRAALMSRSKAETIDKSACFPLNVALRFSTSAG